MPRSGGTPGIRRSRRRQDGPARPRAEVAAGQESGRKPGRPKGQPGATLEFTASPDEVIVHEPGRCAGCGKALAAAPSAGMTRRQVTDVPPVRPVVTEHRMVARRCGCGTVTAAPAPAGVTAPVQYGPRLTAIGAYLWHGQFLSRNRTGQVLSELFGVTVSPGAVTAMVTRVTGALGPALEAIRDAAAAAAGRPFR